MPYAANGLISQDQIEGSIEITAEQYVEALAGMESGKVVTIDGGFQVAFPAAPEAPEEPEPTLDDLKSRKSDEITAACLAEIDSGFVHDGYPYDSDIVSRTNIIGTATGVQAGIPLPLGFTWRTSDNENVPMDGPGVIALGAALLQHVNQQYATSWQLKAEIEAATTPEEVESIHWPTAP